MRLVYGNLGLQLQTQNVLYLLLVRGNECCMNSLQCDVYMTIACLIFVLNSSGP